MEDKEEETQPVHDYRFCPYCYQHQVDLVGVRGETAYCEICGIDIDVKEWVKY